MRTGTERSPMAAHPPWKQLTWVIGREWAFTGAMGSQTMVATSHCMRTVDSDAATARSYPIGGMSARRRQNLGAANEGRQLNRWRSDLVPATARNLKHGGISAAAQNRPVGCLVLPRRIAAWWLPRCTATSHRTARQLDLPCSRPTHPGDSDG